MALLALVSTLEMLELSGGGALAWMLLCGQAPAPNGLLLIVCCTRQVLFA
jgi:hypothetical protein